MGNDGSEATSLEELNAFRQEIKERVDMEEAVLAKVTLPRKGRMIGYAIAIILLIVCIVLIVNRPNGFLIWVLCSYVLVCFSWLLLFLPTSRKEPGFTKKKRAYKKTHLKSSIKTIAKRRKRLFAEVWIDSFLYGNVMPTIAVGVIFGISIVFAIYYGLVEDKIPLDLVIVIVVQGIALILLRVILIVFRPYARGTLALPGAFKGKLTSARRRGRMAFVIGIMVVFIAILVTGFVLILGMLLPGTGLDKVREFFTANGNANLYTIILMFLVMYVIFRHFQSIMSQPLARDLSSSRVKRLKEEALQPLDQAIGKEGPQGITPSKKEFDLLRLSYYRVAIYKFVKHDWFGLAPLYFIAPDMRYMFDDRVLELLTTAEGIGGVAGRSI